MSSLISIYTIYCIYSSCFDCFNCLRLAVLEKNVMKNLNVRVLERKKNEEIKG